MNVLHRLKARYHHLIERKYLKSIQRKQFNTTISSDIILVIKLLAEDFHVPRYVITEHLIQVGTYQVLKAIEEGRTLLDFRQGIDEITARRGWSGLSPYRLDNIFRTNIQNSYNVGRYKKQVAVAKRRPYWQYDAVNDSNTRPSHLEHDGKVYHHKHPFWDTWYPPNGYRCR